VNVVHAPEESMFWTDIQSTDPFHSKAKELRQHESRVPTGLKLAYTAYMAVLIPVYWHYYGPTNFLYFCDVALIFTLVAIWREDALLASMCSIGIVLPQMFWVADFLGRAAGYSLTGMTDYMFDASHSLFLRLLSRCRSF
jgi:hypothetical protein